MAGEQPSPIAIGADESVPLTSTAAQEANNYTDLSQTTFNMINCFVGAGILTVPFAFRLAGYSACILVVFVAALNWYTALLLGKALDKAAALNPDIPFRSWNMGALARAAFGPAGEYFIRLIFGLELWFALETFLVLTGISVNLLTGISEPIVIIFAGTIGCMSLAMPMTTMSHMSFLAIACMVGGLFALVVCGMGRLWDHAPDLVPSAEQHHTFELGRTPASLSIFLYCFSGIPCLPSIRAAMQRPKEDYPKAVSAAFMYSGFYYLAIGMLGYEFFANDTRRSFLKDLTPVPGEGHSNIYGYIAATAAGLFALKLQAGFPLYAGPVLDAAGLSADHGLSSKQVVLSRMVFGVISVAFAVFARNQIDAIAEIMGAFLTNTTSIMFPVAAYCTLAGKQSQQDQSGQPAQSGEKMGKATTVGHSALLLFGLVYGIVGTTSALSSFWFGRSVVVGQAVAGYVSTTALPSVVRSHL